MCVVCVNVLLLIVVVAVVDIEENSRSDPETEKSPSLPQEPSQNTFEGILLRDHRSPKGSQELYL